MRRAGNAYVGAVTGGVLAGVVGLLAYLGLVAFQILVMEKAGGNALPLQAFYAINGTGLLTGTAVASALFGAWQGFERGGVSGGFVGGLVGPVIPLILAVAITFWSLHGGI
jgi:hypothetical protein